IYGQIARTGEPQRFTQQTKYLSDRWYDVYAYRVGQPEERKVAVLFTDISERKQAEEALRELTERLEERVEERTEQVCHLTPYNVPVSYSQDVPFVYGQDVPPWTTL